MSFPPLPSLLLFWIGVFASFASGLPAQGPMLPMFTDLWEKRLLSNPQALPPWTEVTQSWCGKPGWLALDARWAEEQKKQPRFAVLRGRLAETQGKFDEALTRYAEAPDDEHALFQLGRLSALTGKIEPAEKAFHRLTEHATDPQLRWMSLDALIQKASLLGDFEAGRKLCLDYWKLHADQDSREQVLSKLTTLSVRTGKIADLLTLCREEDVKAGAAAAGYESQVKEWLLNSPNSAELLMQRLGQERMPLPPNMRRPTAREIQKRFPGREKLLALAGKGELKGETALEGLANLLARPMIWPEPGLQDRINTRPVEQAQLEAYLRATADSLKAYPFEIACILRWGGKEVQAFAKELVETMVFPGAKPALWDQAALLMELAGVRDAASVTDKEATQKQLLKLLESIPADLPLTARPPANIPFTPLREGMPLPLSFPSFISTVQWNLTGGQAHVKFLQSWRHGDAGATFSSYSFLPAWLNGSKSWPILDGVDHGLDLQAWAWQALEALGYHDSQALDLWLNRIPDTSLRLVMCARQGDPKTFLRRLAEVPNLEDLSTQALMAAEQNLLRLSSSSGQRGVLVVFNAQDAERQMQRVLQTLLARHPEWDAEIRHDLGEQFQPLQVSNELPAPPALSEQDRKMLHYRFGMRAGGNDNHMLSVHFPAMDRESLRRTADKIRPELDLAQLPHPFHGLAWLSSAEQESAFVLQVAQSAFRGGIKPVLPREGRNSSPLSEPPFGPYGPMDSTGSSLLQGMGFRALSLNESEMLRQWETRHPWKKDLLRLTELLNGAALGGPDRYGNTFNGPDLTREGQEALKQLGAESSDPHFRAIRALLLLGEGKKEEAVAAFQACATPPGPLSILAQLGPDIVSGKMANPQGDLLGRPMPSGGLPSNPSLPPRPAGTEASLKAEFARIEQEWADAAKRPAWEEEGKLNGEVTKFARAGTLAQLIAWLKSAPVTAETAAAKNRMLATALVLSRAPKTEIAAALEEIRKMAPEDPLLWKLEVGELQQDRAHPEKSADAYVKWYHWSEDKKRKYQEPSLDPVWYGKGIADQSLNDLIKVCIHRVRNDVVNGRDESRNDWNKEIEIWRSWTPGSDQQLWLELLNQLQQKRSALLLGNLEMLKYHLKRIVNAGETDLTAEFSLALLTLVPPKDDQAARRLGYTSFSDIRPTLWQEAGHIVSNPMPNCQVVQFLKQGRFKDRQAAVSDALQAVHKENPGDEHLASYVLLDKGQAGALAPADMDALQPLDDDAQIRVMERLRVLLPEDRLPFAGMEALLEKEVLGLLKPEDKELRPSFMRIQGACHSLTQMKAYAEGKLSDPIRQAVCRVIAQITFGTEDMRVLAHAALLRATEEQAEAFRVAASTLESPYVAENFKALTCSFEEAVLCKQPKVAESFANLALTTARRILDSPQKNAGWDGDMLERVSQMLSTQRRFRDILDLHAAHAKSLRRFGPLSSLPQVLQNREQYALQGKLKIPADGLGAPLPLITPNAELPLGFAAESFCFSPSSHRVALLGGEQAAILDGTGKKLTLLAEETVPVLDEASPAPNQNRPGKAGARVILLLEEEKALILGATAKGEGWMRAWNFGKKEAIEPEAVSLPAPLLSWTVNPSRTFLAGILGNRNEQNDRPPTTSHVIVVQPSGKVLLAAVPPLRLGYTVTDRSRILAWSKDNSRVWVVVEGKTLVFELGETALKLVDKHEIVLQQADLPKDAEAAPGAFDFGDWTIDKEFQLVRADEKTGRILGRLNPGMNNTIWAIGPYRDAGLLLQDKQTHTLYRFPKADLDKALKEERKRLE